MKPLRYLLLIIVCLLQITCRNETINGFRLKLTITGDVGKFALLQYIDKSGERTDTAYLQDEEIIFKGDLIGPQLVQLQFPEINKTTEIFIENKDIHVRGAIDQLADLEVEGSELNNDFRVMNASIKTVVDSINYYDSLYILDNDPAYEVKYNLFRTMEKSRIRDFIARNRTSPVSLNALVNHFSNSPSFVEIDPLYKMLDSNLQRSLYGKYFYDEILTPAKNTEIGMIAPNFSFTDIKGDSIELKSLHGKVVLLVFWASWNLPSIQLNEEIKMLRAAYGENNFEVVQIACEKNLSNWKRAVDEQGLNWLNYADGLGFKSPIAKLYGVKAVPYNLLLDKNGEILAKNIRGQMLQYEFWKLFGSF